MINSMCGVYNFRFATLHVNGEFVALLKGFVNIYGKIVKSRIKLENDEKTIRKAFLRYLKDKNYANSIEPFKDYSVDAEVEENDGFLDLKITTRKSLADPMEYFSIECKRLNDKNQRGKTGLNAKYVKEGIRRYKDEDYTAYHGCNGMVGFVVANMDIAYNTQCINSFLARSEWLKKVNVIPDFDNAYLSSHRTVSGRQLMLYHLMFDFSKNIKQKP